MNTGLRGTRYFIEFPITGKNVDAFSILASTQSLINSGKEKFGSRVVSTDSYIQDENMSYLIDYEVNSTSAMGAKNKGSIYIRGIKSNDGGYDSFKFILEKAVDFNDLDSQLVLRAYEEAFKPRAQPIQVANNSRSPSNVKRPVPTSQRQSSSPQNNPGFIAGLVG